MQVKLLQGIYSSQDGDLRVSYPVNLAPVAEQSGLSGGYIRPTDGIVSHTVGPGIDMGGINWNGICYRVMGTKLVKVLSDGTIVVLGDVGASVGRYATLDYGPDRLAIAVGGRLYYWVESTSTLVQVTDPDLGNVIDMLWVDGYYMTTDGYNLVVTNLTDPLTVSPTNYGQSEADPDPIVALLKIHNEVYALNRHTIEVFDNVGGNLFPFARIEGAQIEKGVIGTHACCEYMDAVAFLGSGFNEPPGVYIGANASVTKISTNEIDHILREYTEAQLSVSKLESRTQFGRKLLYVHLQDKTLVYDAETSAMLKSPVWAILTSSTSGFSEYRARNFVWCYDKWLVSDPQSAALGYLDDSVGSHWGDVVRWELNTPIIYNEGRGAILNELELVVLSGRFAPGANPKISTSYSLDGRSWSQEREISVLPSGLSNKRLVWRRQGFMKNWRTQRFRGHSDSMLTMLRLEAQIEALTT